jgi:hypothetical protein
MAADFVGGMLPSGTVSFAAGETGKTVTVNVAGDTAMEADEGFTVTLSAPTGAALTGASAIGSILNDDVSVYVTSNMLAHPTGPVFTATPHATSPDPLVDVSWYYNQYPSVAASGLDPYNDYMFNNGWQSGRNPDALFNTSWYLKENPDVAASGINPLLHYELYGWKEGRDPSPLFSTKDYLAHNPAVAAAGIDPLLHYITQRPEIIGGLHEGNKLSRLKPTTDPGNGDRTYGNRPTRSLTPKKRPTTSGFADREIQVMRASIMHRTIVNAMPPELRICINAARQRRRHQGSVQLRDIRVYDKRQRHLRRGDTR